MANRQNLLEADFPVQRTNAPAATTTSSESGSLPPEKKFANMGTSFFTKWQAMKPRRLIFACGIAGMLGWISVFGIGMLVNSKTYRDQLATNFDFATLAKAIISFTPTNVALLAMLAGFLGGCASLLMYSDYSANNSAKQNGKAPIDLERLAYLQENPVSSALRGFVVYLTFLAGTVFGASGAFANTTQDQYCRLAGAVAVLAFGVGYDPTVFRQVLSLVTRRTEPGAKPAQPDRSLEPAPTK
jgi:hypothetical protein